MDLTDTELEQKLNAFKQEREPDRMHEALDMIRVAEQDMPARDLKACRRALSRWLRFFAALDSSIDPEWNPNDQPTMYVPLPSSHGVIYPSGEVDPSTIPDPVERAAYERALEANKSNYKRYFIQFQLQRIDDHAMHLVKNLLTNKYTNSFGDRDEFEELLAETTVSDLRKERLRELLGG